jgi:hypothetical protein
VTVDRGDEHPAEYGGPLDEDRGEVHINLSWKRGDGSGVDLGVSGPGGRDVTALAIGCPGIVAGAVISRESLPIGLFVIAAVAAAVLVVIWQNRPSRRLPGPGAPGGAGRAGAIGMRPAEAAPGAPAGTGMLPPESTPQGVEGSTGKEDGGPVEGQAADGTPPQTPV